MKTLSIFLVCTLSIFCVQCDKNEGAKRELPDGQTWYLTYTMTATLDNDGVLTISSTKKSEAMPEFHYPYYYWEGSEPFISWYEMINEIRSIVIDKSITYIGLNAFQNYKNLTSITIPNSVTKIGENAFRNCESLASITIPNSLTSLEKNVFRGCTSLKSITIISL